MFIAAKIIAINPNVLDVLKTFSVELAKAAINIFGGFLVTQRMLQMYKKKKKDK